MNISDDVDFDCMDAEQQFRTIWEDYMIARPGADKLLGWMQEEGFFAAPASAKYHLNIQGGLCTHTLNVAWNAIDLCNTAAFSGVDKREAMTAALLHDLCKIGKYQQGDNGQYVYTDDRMLGHGEESAIIALQFMQLSQNELLAIRWHMGAYTDTDKWNTLGKAYDVCPLAMLLHFADMMAAHCDEVER